MLMMMMMMMMMMMAASASAAGRRRSVEEIRARFPSLTATSNGGMIFLDNAGGSQVPYDVIDSVSKYFVDEYVQLGAGYDQSIRADATYDLAHEYVQIMTNAETTMGGEAVLGSSSTQLFRIIAKAFGESDELVTAGDVVIVSECNHESNTHSWLELEASTGVRIVWWKINIDAQDCILSDLQTLLLTHTTRVRLVAYPHVSNIFGTIVDVPAVSNLVKTITAGRALTVVDGVAYAPHRAIDLQALGADFYVFSLYKVYTVHLAAAVASAQTWLRLKCQGFYLHDPSDIRKCFEPGKVPHELTAGVVAMGDYFNFVAGVDDVKSKLTRQAVVAAFDVFTEMEAVLQERMMEYLLSRRDNITIIGSLASGVNDRVTTFAFIHNNLSSQFIASEVVKANIGIRYG
jgi:selenocysteine lyase/cysteine desulfurase